MPDKWQIATGVLALCLAHDIRVTRRNRKRFEHNLQVITELATELNHSDAQVNYLISILEENEIVPDEFDQIAFHNAFIPE